ncbi:hypothetical protein CALVIDRAFT_411287 [Calocera viscosa TUFC12733]|uniref:Uncharacterized protein n=1 Tax=Calocera viscosa (strain TUFC12733) TaxID=1330018 RepID=A0A167G7Q6_CALVF|nr:hypothetical protein CALVIDRAFT_411287 [Calocera viscosa TUFC12733]
MLVPGTASPRADLFGYHWGNHPTIDSLYSYGSQYDILEQLGGHLSYRPTTFFNTPPTFLKKFLILSPILLRASISPISSSKSRAATSSSHSSSSPRLRCCQVSTSSSSSNERAAEYGTIRPLGVRVATSSGTRRRSVSACSSASRS